MVLDLGSGGGVDVLLSARRVGPTGKAYGLDVTDDMLALANENELEPASRTSSTIEHIPLPDNSVDVIISNCVINLSGDKPRAARRFACSSRAERRRLGRGRHTATCPPTWVTAWNSGTSAASPGRSNVTSPQTAGRRRFDGIDLGPTRVYKAADARAFLVEAGLDRPGLAESDRRS